MLVGTQIAPRRVTAKNETTISGLLSITTATHCPLHRARRHQRSLSGTRHGECSGTAAADCQSQSERPRNADDSNRHHDVDELDQRQRNFLYRQFRCGIRRLHGDAALQSSVRAGHLAGRGSNDGECVSSVRELSVRQPSALGALATGGALLGNVDRRAARPIGTALRSIFPLSL